VDNDPGTLNKEFSIERFTAAEQLSVGFIKPYSMREHFKVFDPSSNFFNMHDAFPPGLRVAIEKS